MERSDQCRRLSGSDVISAYAGDLDAATIQAKDALEDENDEISWPII